MWNVGMTWRLWRSLCGVHWRSWVVTGRSSLAYKLLLKTNWCCVAHSVLPHKWARVNIIACQELFHPAQRRAMALCACQSFGYFRVAITLYLLFGTHITHVAYVNDCTLQWLHSQRLLAKWTNLCKTSCVRHGTEFPENILCILCSLPYFQFMPRVVKI